MNFEFSNADPFSATFDHLKPVAHRGTWAPENLLLAHKDCNNRRGHRAHVMCLDPPAPKLKVVFDKAWARRRFSAPADAPIVRPHLPSVAMPWTVQWLIDKQLMKKR